MLSRFYPVLLGFTGFLLFFTRFYWILLGSTRFYWVLLGFTRVISVILKLTWFHSVSSGFYGIRSSLSLVIWRESEFTVALTAG